MRAAAADLEFEEAARLRDEIKRLEEMDLGVLPTAVARPAAIASTGSKQASGKARARRAGRGRR